jgi:ubiquinone/menaquinone biosynthesis C-methylase UbiE
MKLTSDSSVHPSSNAATPDPRIGFFDSLAPRWDSQCSHPARTLQRLDELKGRLHFVPGLRILELGCGTGQITGWLLRRVGPKNVVAADFSTAMLEQARATGVDATFELLDICSSKSSNGPFDVVLCFNAFPHFRDKAQALEHIKDSLTPSGRLIVLHLTDRETLNHFHAGLNAPVNSDMLPDREEWTTLLTTVGLSLCTYENSLELFLLEAGRM